MRLRWISVTVGLALVQLLAAGPPAVADCGADDFTRPLSSYRGTAFVGTVTATETIETPPGTELVVLTIEVERPIAGDPPRVMRVGGAPAGDRCHHFLAGAFDVGDRLLLSFRSLDSYEGRPEGVEVAWTTLPWRPTADGDWRFARRAVTGPEWYPKAARDADTLREIEALVRPRPPKHGSPTLDLAAQQAIVASVGARIWTWIQALFGG